MIDSCVEFLVAIHGHEPCAVNSTGVVSTIRRTMIYRVAEKWHFCYSAEPRQPMHCVGETHCKKTFIIQSLLAITGGFRERNAHNRTFFIFTLFMSPHEEGSPFDNPVKLCQNTIINEVAIIIVFKATESDVG